MSSFSGTDTVGIQGGDANALQLAPAGNEGPDFNVLKKGFEETVSNNQPYVDQCRLNFQTRYAIWNGQSPDGKKHAREGAKIDPTPWDGASDLRVYLADSIINKKVAMLCTSFRKANLVAVPVEGNDLKRAKIVSNFMRWLIQTQIPDIDREVELLANFVKEKGIGITGQFWETRQEKTLARISVEDFQAQFPGVDIQGALTEGIYDDTLIAMFEEVYGASKSKAKKMLASLKATGEATVAIVGKEKSYPVIRAFNLDTDIFIPPDSTDLETARAIYRVQYFSPEQLRSFARTDGWDEVWVERAIKTCRGQMLSPTLDSVEVNQPRSRSFIYTDRRFTELIGVVYAYQRLSDEDGVPGIYLTILNPFMGPTADADGTQPGYAKFGLLGYAHGQYPFILHRAEYLSRKLHDSRGIPEPIKPLQEQIKAHKDSRIDAASMAVLPPLCYPLGRPPLNWGPGERIPERRPNEYHYADRPLPDMNTDDSEDRLSASAKEYVGFASQEGDPQISPLDNQEEVNKFLAGWAKAFRQVWSLYQQYGKQEVFFRVIGLREADPTLFQKKNAAEDFDIYLSWDVQSTDLERQQAKLTAVVQLAQVADRNGSVDYDEILQIGLEAVDPNWAERIIRPASVGSDRVIKETQDDLAKIAAGMNVNMRPGTPPQIAQATLQNWVQGARDVQQRLMSDEAFKARVEAYAKQVQFQIQQQQNAVTGRLGAQMPGPVIGR